MLGKSYFLAVNVGCWGQRPSKEHVIEDFKILHYVFTLFPAKKVQILLKVDGTFLSFYIS